MRISPVLIESRHPRWAMLRRTVMTAVLLVLLGGGTAHAATGPRYDVPQGFTRCAHAQAWHGFFKWASQEHATCRRAAAFMREYAERADGARMPTRVGGYRCRIRYWRSDEGDVYASRHVCARGDVTIRFYGMV
jgi:hypothetical protein